MKIKNQFLKAAMFSGVFLTAVSSYSQIKLLRGVRDNIMDESNKNVSLAKYEIDKVMQHTDTRDMCAAWAWKGVVYSEVALSGDTSVRALDKDNSAALASGEAFLRFYACSVEEQEKVDALVAANLYVVNAISACWNEAIYASQKKGSYEIVKKHMLVVEKLLPYDKEEKAKGNGVTREQALYAIWRTAYNDSLIDEEIIYLEKLMEIPTYLNSYIYVRMAQILSEKKKYDKALEYLDKGKLKIPQKSGDFLDMQINIEIERENMVALLAKLNESIENNPENPQYYFARGVSYHKLKDDELKDQEQAYKNNTTPAASKYHFSQGLSDYRKALELDPGYFDALKNEAILMFDSANYIYKMRIRVAPAEYEKYNALSISLYKQALDKFEALRASGFLKDQDLVDALKDMKTICIKIGDQEGKLKYDTMMKAEKKKLEEKAQ